MKIELSNPPRIFHIPLPNGERITLSDCAHITLGVDEQITLFTDNGNEYDITRKDWGYYATPRSIADLLTSICAQSWCVG
ncbi:MAG UNVERIFIED_CONTAM: hypothetical protein LVT10_01100 [Anaerolineae bacterium]|jgi:hypothetical protein